MAMVDPVNAAHAIIAMPLARLAPMSATPATLWLVATPIGHFDDFSPRAKQVLGAVAAIACEDTRHSRPLLAKAGIERPLLALHEHNETQETPRLLARLAAGESIALIADAGTPLISDPGYRLVAAARAAQIPVSAVPGACAAIVALTLSGLATDRFVFEGFLPAKSAARRARLQALACEPRTLIIYESKHRIEASLNDLIAVFGGERRAVLARELTKLHETVLGDRLDEIAARVAADPNQRLGEFVLVIEGAPPIDAAALLAEGQRVLRILARELKPSVAAKLAAEISGAPRKALYAGGADAA